MAAGGIFVKVMDGVEALVLQAAVQTTARTNSHGPGDNHPLTIHRIVPGTSCPSVPRLFRMVLVRNEGEGLRREVYRDLPSASRHFCEMRTGRRGSAEWSGATLLEYGLAEPFFEPGLAESRLAGRNQRALVEFNSEVPRGRVDDHFARVVARGEALTDQLVERDPRHQGVALKATVREMLVR